MCPDAYLSVLSCAQGPARLKGGHLAAKQTRAVRWASRYVPAAVLARRVSPCARLRRGRCACSAV